ncbi:hypothetical protein [Atopococcus tabaci]|uniref:hypothetical protein n=1 Tax=Atopococcus tabaci TaxID=269774 RepID=UPI0004194219|nr:hypothetical protein [Atopococcus tabaci]
MQTPLKTCALKEYTAAESLLEEADSRWKQDETLFLLKLQLYHKTKNGWEIKKAVQQIKESGIYLSPSTQEVVAFWSGKSERQP